MSVVDHAGRLGITDPRDDQPWDSPDEAKRKWHISLFGALKRTHGWNGGARHVFVIAFGDAELDLRQAEIEKNLAISIVVIFGSANITVPCNVSVETNGFTLLGSEQVEDHKPIAVQEVLHLRTFNFLSSIRVRRGT